jgi:hypothetical protein
MPAEIGQWFGDPNTTCEYQDRNGNIRLGPAAIMTAARERDEYEASQAHRRDREYAQFLRRVESLPLQDPFLEQPATLDPIQQTDIWFSPDRMHLRSWIPITWEAGWWQPVSSSLTRVAVVHEELWAILYRRKWGDHRDIWTRPLRWSELSKEEQAEATGNPRPEELDATQAVRRGNWASGDLFSANMKQWYSPGRDTYVSARSALVYVGITSHDYWRLSYTGWHSVEKKRLSVLSVPMHWDQLTDGERRTFERRPLEMPTP